MLIYFLGGESEFLHGTDFRLFKKIGSFAQALKINRPQLIVAENGFLGPGFDLQSFLSEQRVKIPIVYLNKGRGLLSDIKSRGKISDKLFELLKILYNSQKSQNLAQIRASLFDAGIEWTDNCARVSLWRLKKILQSQEDLSVDLIKEYDGYRLALSNQLVKVGV